MSPEEGFEALMVGFLMAAGVTGNIEHRQVTELMKQLHDEIEFMISVILNS